MASDSNQSEWMTLADIASDLRVPLATVYQWSSGGELPKIKIGKHVRIRRADFEAWCDAHAA